MSVLTVASAPATTHGRQISHACCSHVALPFFKETVDSCAVSVFRSETCWIGEPIGGPSYVGRSLMSGALAWTSSYARLLGLS